MDGSKTGWDTGEIRDGTLNGISCNDFADAKITV